MDDVFDILLRHLDDPATGWSIGTFGAIAEFHRDAGEAARISLEADRGRVVTARGAIEIRRHAAARLVPYETVSAIPTAWSQGVMVCLPADAADRAGPKGVALLGPDTEPLLTADEEALFDLGVGFRHIEACVRTADASLIAALNAAAGKSFMDLPAATVQAVKDANPVRVFRSRMGRIEVAQAIPESGGETPMGPHTHVLPDLLGRGREQAANIPVPDGWVIAVAFYPAHPVRDADGSLKTFDRAAFEGFQQLIDDHAPEELAAAKRDARRLLDADAPAEPGLAPASRHARTAFRVALRQWEHVNGQTPASTAWRRLCDPTGQAGDDDLRPPHEADT